MRATAAPVEGNRVRLSVEVDEAEVDRAVDSTARRLAREIRVPGFRPGHVPRQVLEARLGGPSALRQQAITDALPDLYARAVSDTELDPIAAPEIDVTSGEDAGPVTFDVVVEVRPTVSLPGYQGLAVTIPSIEVADSEVDAQVDRLREQSGELHGVTRAAADGDHVTIDLHARRAGAPDFDLEDYLYEVGSGSDVPGLDDELRGAKPGDILQFSARAALEDAPGEGGKAAAVGGATFRVLVKEVKEKLLPEPTDIWASEASEFDTLEELRADLKQRLAQIKVVQAQLASRDRALEALIALVEDDPPEALVDEETKERLHDLGHRLEARRMTLDQFLEASGRSREELLAEIRSEAVRDVLADLALRALADAEGIEVSDEELDRAVEEIAEEAGQSKADVRSRLDRSGRLAAVRSGRRKAKALSWLLEHVELVDEDGQPVSREALRLDVGRQDEAGESPEPPDKVAAGGPRVDDEAGGLGSEDVRAGDLPPVEAQP
ncbi:MAG TPA: trigger factor [Acidimicrobiales bacterium]|nr:trigger factor [Acidimicrobiales bacterium]